MQAHSVKSYRDAVEFTTTKQNVMEGKVYVLYVSIISRCMS